MKNIKETNVSMFHLLENETMKHCNSKAKNPDGISETVKQSDNELGNYRNSNETLNRCVYQMPDFKNSDGTIRIKSLALWLSQNKQLKKNETFIETSLKQYESLPDTDLMQGSQAKAWQIGRNSEQRSSANNECFNVSMFHSLGNETMKQSECRVELEESETECLNEAAEVLNSNKAAKVSDIQGATLIKELQQQSEI